nr:substrate-binding domain-containing protein [Jiella sonneratiae]
MTGIGDRQAVIRMGLTPGHDLSVIGFDDVHDAAVAPPPLTTMAIHPYRLGRRLARVTLRRIRDPDMSVALCEVSAELVIRETTGAPPQYR